MPTYDPTQPRRNVVRLKQLQRASRRLAVTPLSTATASYRVSSASQPGQSYYVMINPETLTGQCTCPWA